MDNVYKKKDLITIFNAPTLIVGGTRCQISSQSDATLNAGEYEGTAEGAWKSWYTHMCFVTAVISLHSLQSELSYLMFPSKTII